MKNELIVITVEDVKKVFRESLAELVDIIKVPAKQNANPVKPIMSIDEALQFSTTITTLLQKIHYIKRSTKKRCRTTKSITGDWYFIGMSWMNG